MKKFFFIVFIFIYACSPKNVNNKENLDFIFSGNMTFDETKSKLEEYSMNKPFPNLDE